LTKKNPKKDLLIDHHGEESFSVYASAANLEEVKVGIDHRVAEIALNVRHGLAFDL